MNPKSFELSEEQIAKAHIVVVDDEPVVTEALRTFLDVSLDVEPRCFNAPADALDHVRNEPVDLVISDFLMPGMNGIELLKAIREVKPEVPRVMLTGYADKENAIAAINEVKLFQYVEKPWENAHLEQVVRSALAHGHLLRLVSEKMAALAAAEDDLEEMRKALVQAFT